MDEKRLERLERDLAEARKQLGRIEYRVKWLGHSAIFIVVVGWAGLASNEMNRNLSGLEFWALTALMCILAFVAWAVSRIDRDP